MTILNQWIKDLGYDKQQINGSAYYCNDSSSVLVPLKSIKFPFERPRKIHIEGMEEQRAKHVLNEIFNYQHIYPIEVYKLIDDKNYLYEIKHGYHRYTISEFLNFTEIPVIMFDKYDW